MTTDYFLLLHFLFELHFCYFLRPTSAIRACSSLARWRGGGVFSDGSVGTKVFLGDRSTPRVRTGSGRGTAA